MTAQLSLFETETELADREWMARFADWTVEFDCGLGPAGAVISGWVCPACHMIEPTTYCLWINHGFDPHCKAASALEDRFSVCVRMSLLACREAALAKRRAP